MNEPDTPHPMKKPDLILVIDNDDDISNMLRIYFGGHGYEVLTANSSDGKAVLENALNLTPDLVMLDPLKPGVEGFEVLKALRKEIETQNIPLIIMTQKDERNDRLSDLIPERDDYMTKPFDIEELKLRIESSIRRK